jgi:hypothetical protein
VLHNVCLTTTVTGKPDNTPLKITNTFWFFMDDGCLQAGSGTLPVALLTGEASIDGDSADADAIERHGHHCLYLRRESELAHRTYRKGGSETRPYIANNLSSPFLIDV